MKTIYVDHKFGDDANDGLSQASAKRTIHAVEDMLEDGDTVLTDYLGGKFDAIFIKNNNVTFTTRGARIPTVKEVIEAECKWYTEGFPPK